MFGTITVLFVEELLLVRLLPTCTKAMYVRTSSVCLAWIRPTTKQLKVVQYSVCIFAYCGSVLYVLGNFCTWKSQMELYITVSLYNTTV